jgi:predicted RecB family nuclease
MGATADLAQETADTTTAQENLTRDEIVAVSRAFLAARDIKHSRQGGYSAKTMPHLLAIDNMPNTYPPELKIDYSSAQLDRMNSGNLFEDEIGDALRGVPGVVVIDEERDENGDRTVEGKNRKEEATFSAYLDPKVNFIFNARMGGRFSELVSEHVGQPLDDEDRVSEPDAIELGPIMGNGLRAMRFVDVKWHKSTDGKTPKMYPVSQLTTPTWETSIEEQFTGNPQLGDLMQLSHYYRHGQSLGLVDDDASLWGAVIGKESVLLWARLDAANYQKPDPDTGKRRHTSALAYYDRRFRQALEVLDNALARDIDPTIPALTGPEWCGDVQESQWKAVVYQEVKDFGDGGHITLLPGITPDRAKPLYDAGIFDIGTLAALHPESEVEGVNDLAKYIYQARVTYFDQVARNIDVEFVHVDRADIEVDFDYETDHVVYQRGVRVLERTEADSEPQMTTYDDFTGTDAGELEVFIKMWSQFEDLVAEAVATDRTIRFYHYTHFEKTQDARLAEKYAGTPGVPTVAEVEQFYGSEVCVDLYQVLKSELVWPTKSHSIKDVAPYVGFAWRDETPGGAESMVWYRTVLSTEDADLRAELILRGQVYNEDDVHAQAALRDWVCDHGSQARPGEDLPAVEDLPHP